ncbi:putative RDD family membrane protein YckC [Mucilaginibacter yixingensis]|uniref:Putative RDD family membrane protein YckC n=1 Tax=Mucilaginibacter yixingensis TaxID=1295612 RepID=A0A2T5JCL9_9SPHI|nr:RDD family protein [Mucilaginibacter yixingensis]PTQ99510.1 putative RDD family membrane protein YckC [Mucilaginibacter yixingensis]
MQTVRIRTSQNIDIDYEVAGLGDRILAHIIDTGVIAAFGYILYYIVIFTVLLSPGVLKSSGSGVAGIPVSIIVILIVFTTLAAFYDLVAEIFFNGQSLGKFAMKIRVVSLNGARPGTGQFFLRWVFRLLDLGITVGIGALIAVAMSEKKQRIGDMVAGTTLIKTQPRTQLDELYFLAPEDDYTPILPEVGNLTDNEISLIHEVITTFKTTGNSMVVYDMAMQIKNHLNMGIPAGMNEYDFLLAVVKDYNYVTSRTEV